MGFGTIFLWQRTWKHDILGGTKPGTGDEMADDMLREERIRRYLKNNRLKLRVYDSITEFATTMDLKTKVVYREIAQRKPLKNWALVFPH